MKNIISLIKIWFPNFNSDNFTPEVKAVFPIFSDGPNHRHRLSYGTLWAEWTKRVMSEKEEGQVATVWQMDS